MLSKVLAVTHSKVALAVLGVVLVGGGGSAVAVAATTGHLSTLGVNLSSEHSNSPSSDSHAHTIGVEGLLTACSTSTTPATISVKDSAGKSWTFVVSATTKINGDTHSDASQNGGSATGTGASSAKGDNSTHAGGASTGSAATGTGASSAKGDNSAHAGDNSANADGASSTAGDNSAHAAATLADVCASANIGTRDVQVQATKDGSTYDAWKVTLQGPASASSDGSGSGDSSSNGASSNGASSNGASSDAPGN